MHTPPENPRFPALTDLLNLTEIESFTIAREAYPFTAQ